jgi:excisionase family DNA binding protein
MSVNVSHRGFSMTATASPADDLTPTEAAALLHRTERTLWRLVADGKLRGRKVLGRVVFRRTDVERLLEGDPIGGQAAELVPAAG